MLQGNRHLPQDSNRTPMTVSYNDRGSTPGSRGSSVGNGQESVDGGRDREARNTAWLEAYQVVVRIGWIFKTETIIMPAVLDAVVDSGLLRGLLPVLNRGGQSLPPLFVSGALGRLPRKQWTLVATSLAMAACFGLLAVAWGPLEARRPDLLALLFLVLYAGFSAVNGLNQLAFAALQGQLVSPGRRGRALVVGTALGSVLAIVAAVVLLGPWLGQPDGFPKIFAATALFFAVAAILPIFLDEPVELAEAAASLPAPTVGRLAGMRAAVGRGVDAWRRTLAADAALVRLTAVAACFSAVLIMFPHYQAFARDRLGSRIDSLLWWVVVQNAATGVASLFAGPVSDRRGTRDVLVWLVALSAATPLIATGLSLLPHATAVEWFWLVYVPLGLNPISLKIFTNYALELAPAAVEHPRYVSIVGAALAAPFVVSPLVGMAVDRFGFRHVFVVGAAVIACGAVVAAGLPEPRHR
jgi:predicted MFS family arabinose efflux permease